MRPDGLKGRIGGDGRGEEGRGRESRREKRREVSVHTTVKKGRG